MVQVNNGHVTVRIKFTKVGSLQYISHLDLVRTMHKIIVRARLPLWYTEGFNPKPKMVFAAPLSIGCESVCEYMDLRLTEVMAPEEIMTRLNQNLTEEMRVTEVYYPETKLTDLRWLEYEINIKTGGDLKVLLESCNRCLSNDEIKVIKRSKKGETLTDIRPLIKSSELSVCDGKLKLVAILSADQSQFLNPEYLITALKSESGILSDERIINEYYSIMRTRALTDELSLFR